MNPEERKLVEEITTLISSRIEGNADIARADAIEMMFEIATFCEACASAMTEDEEHGR